MKATRINYNLVRKLLETGHDVNEVAQLLNIDISGIYRYCRNNNMTIVNSIYHPEIPYMKRKYKTPRKITRITYRHSRKKSPMNDNVDYLFDINNITLENTLIPDVVSNDDTMNSYNVHNEIKKINTKSSYSDRMKDIYDLTTIGLEKLITDLTNKIVNVERDREYNILKKIKLKILEAYRMSYAGDLATKTILRNTLDYINKIILESDEI